MQLRSIAFVLAGVLVAACGDKVVQSTAPDTPVVASGAAPSPSASAVASASPPKVEFQENEFTESDRSRDPFRSYASMFMEETRGSRREGVGREVLLDQYSLDEVKLVGIVTGVDPALAMLVDPTGKGHVVHRGQFVGRPEVVQGGGQAGAAYEINWRVDRIRDGDIVMVREDPQNPDVPSATRVIPLRPEADNGEATH